MSTPADTWLNIWPAADLTGVPLLQLRRLTADGILVSTRIDGRTYLSLHSLQTYMQVKRYGVEPSVDEDDEESAEDAVAQR